MESGINAKDVGGSEMENGINPEDVKGSTWRPFLPIKKSAGLKTRFSPQGHRA